MNKGRIQSIKQRLKNLSDKLKIKYDYILLIYMFEGFLGRLSRSPFSSNFILKGGFLLSSIFKKFGRSTRDLDFSGMGIDNSVSQLKKVISEICKIKVDDELVFDIDNVTAEKIIADDIYSGTRILVPCFLDKSRQTIQMDIGFGDKITPESKRIEYHVLLAENSFSLFVYPVETIIAEKFEAIITLDEANSRMKDFFDLYMLLDKSKTTYEILFLAINITFNTRKTVLPKNPAIFQSISERILIN